MSEEELKKTICNNLDTVQTRINELQNKYDEKLEKMKRYLKSAVRVKKLKTRECTRYNTYINDNFVGFMNRFIAELDKIINATKLNDDTIELYYTLHQGDRKIYKCVDSNQIDVIGHKQIFKLIEKMRSDYNEIIYTLNDDIKKNAELSGNKCSTFLKFLNNTLNILKKIVQKINLLKVRVDMVYYPGLNKNPNRFETATTTKRNRPSRKSQTQSKSVNLKKLFRSVKNTTRRSVSKSKPKSLKLSTIEEGDEDEEDSPTPTPKQISDLPPSITSSANNAGHEVVGVRGFAGEISLAQRGESRKSNMNPTIFNFGNKAITRLTKSNKSHKNISRLVI